MRIQQGDRMKVGIFGDVHANYEALRAVLDRLDDEDCDDFVCTGDTVGYGPQPGPCVDEIRERDVYCVLGNHDKYATLVVSDQLDRLDPATRESIQWTQNTLTVEQLRWLAELPLRLDFDEFTVLHGSFGPKRWAYLVNKENLALSFAHQDVPLAISGHSHLPVLCLADDAPDGEPTIDFLKSMVVPKRPKVLLNPGSVGQPRDRDPRASCITYDTATREVHLIRVEYDLAATQARMREAGLPERFAERLEQGR
jgi:predicted phosphodiesterase